MGSKNAMYWSAPVAVQNFYGALAKNFREQSELAAFVILIKRG